MTSPAGSQAPDLRRMFQELNEIKYTQILAQCLVPRTVRPYCLPSQFPASPRVPSLALAFSHPGVQVNGSAIFA